MKLTTWLKWGTVIVMMTAFIGGWTTTFMVGAQASTWHVAIDGSDSTGDGSQANPFATIQHGIDVATNSDTVLVHPGVYQENINFLGKNITVGSLFVTTGDEDYTLQTVIDGQRQGHVVTFENGEAATAQLSGLTITNGYAQDTSWPGDSGGGVFCLNSSSPTLTHLRVSGNEAVHEGGGLYFGDCSSTVKDIVVTNNLAGTGGGGIRYSYGTVSLENMIVAHNSAGLGGSGIQFYHSPGLVKNSVIADNFGGGKGGGLHFDGCSPTFIHVSIIGNWTSGHGGALNVSYMSQPTFLNSIVWGNVPEQIYFDTDWPGEAVTIEHSDIQGGEAGIVTNGQGPVYWLEGNMDLSPSFVHAGLGNYRLADDSPCISAGKAAGAPATDIEGNPRPNPAGSPPDMGAYENPLGWLTVQFSSDTYGGVEGTGQAAITVTLNAASPLTVTVAYSTTDGTAVAGSDYLTVSGMLTFAPGVTNQAFSVPILDDEIDEPAETVSLTLSGPANALLGIPGTAVLSIADDDAPYRVYLPLVALPNEA
ncbi:MAG: hypothetical protein JXA93_09275, partial [Anaerolineae bacterium]|nr:hypothetical protein [Anaerolineae bacterium]